MRLTSSSPLWALALLTLSTTFTLRPRQIEHENIPALLEEREAEAFDTSLLETPARPIAARFVDGDFTYLAKRRGGGGGSSGGGGGGSGGGGGGGGSGGGGSGGGGSGGGGSGSGGGSSGGGSAGGGGGSSGGGGRGGSSGSSSSSGSSGSRGPGSAGDASSRSVARPTYGGGGFFGGGSTKTYKAGSRTPKGLLAFGVIGVAAAALLIPGLWLHDAYGYNYRNPYGFRNRTANRNDSLPVVCLCQQYSACGCDENDNSTYLDDLIGDGDYRKLNKSLVNVADVNGTRKLVINGTLPNGTDLPDSNPTSRGVRNIALENAGFWAVGAIVGAMLYVL